MPVLRRLLWRLLALLALLAACSRAPMDPGPTEAPLATAPLATQPAGAAQEAATARPGAQPSLTPTPTITPTATATATAAPAAINPLTGLAVAGPAVLDRRPLAIKIAHFPRGVREDQVGLSAADNVWEHYAEGGTVRFTAIFLSQGPERIGNVRSARLLDVHLGKAYQAILVASGSSSGTMQRLRETDFYDRIISEYAGYGGCPLLCREASAAVSSHKLYTSAPALWAKAEALGFSQGQPQPGFAFSAQPPAGGEPAETIHIDFQVDNTVTEWRYDGATRSYARWIDTSQMPELAQHVDAANGQALAAATVVLLQVPYVPANIHEEEGGKLYYSYDVPLVGQGPAWVFRDGLAIEAAWQRAEDPGGLPVFVDASGEVIPFRPGPIWFEVVDPDSPTRFEAGTFYVRVKVPPGPAPTATP